MIDRDSIKIILSEIKTWIVFFFIIRLVGITNAPLEIGHNWRQSLTNMIARNFLEGNASLLYPQIDMAGNLSGIIGSEFPLYNYLIYLVSLIFGYSHWYGRLINLLVSSVGVYYFYLLAEKLSNKKIAFNASIVLLVSLWFGFSRKIMPDTFSVSLVIMGLYFGYTYLYSGSYRRLSLFFIFVTLGMLCKIPALSLMALIPLLLMVKEIPFTRRMIVIFTSGISLLIVSLWYFYWVPYLVNTYHFQLFFTKGLSEGFKEILPLLPEFFEKFYFSSLCSFLAFGFFLAGLYVVFSSRNRYLIAGILIITFTFLVFILKTGAVFPLHSYYIIPFVPVMAFVAGFGLYRIPSGFLYIPLILIAIEAIANQQHDFFIKDNEKYKPLLENLTAEFIGKNDRIVINGGQSPQMIYFAHRKGWTVDNEKINTLDLSLLRDEGATYLIVDKHALANPAIDFKRIYSDNNFGIYQLK